MNKPSLIVACAAAFIGLGIAMPQCPGDKAMQEQIDGLRQNEQSMTKKLVTMDTQDKTLVNEQAQSKQLVTQIASVVMAQKDAIDRMNVAVKDLQTKMAELEKKTSSHAKPRGRRHR